MIILETLLIFSDGYGYTKQSVEKAKMFVEVCVSLLGTDSHLWIAFQSNVLYDLAYTTKEFSQLFKEMTEEMSNQHGFYLPTLSVNMRNSREITELSNVVKPESSFHKIRNDILDILSTQKTSVVSRKPRLIPIEKRNCKRNSKM